MTLFLLPLSVAELRKWMVGSANPRERVRSCLKDFASGCYADSNRYESENERLPAVDEIRDNEYSNCQASVNFELRPWNVCVCRFLYQIMHRTWLQQVSQLPFFVDLKLRQSFAVRPCVFNSKNEWDFVATNFTFLTSHTTPHNTAAFFNESWH